MRRLLWLFAIATTLAIGVTVGACGGSIPDDVEWSVVGGLESGKEPHYPGGGGYRVQLNEPVSEETLRAIGEDIKSRHINICRYRDDDCQWYPELSKVLVWYYLPGMDSELEAWGWTHFYSDSEDIYILGNLQR